MPEHLDGPSRGSERPSPRRERLRACGTRHRSFTRRAEGRLTGGRQHGEESRCSNESRIGVLSSEGLAFRLAKRLDNATSKREALNETPVSLFKAPTGRLT